MEPKKPYYLDQDTDDIDGPVPTYSDDSTFESRMAALGIHDTSDMAAVARRLRELGHALPEQPPLTDS